MPKHEKIDYVEYPSPDLDATKRFFEQVFGWNFVDYGPDYVAFSGAGLDGGFYRAELSARTDTGSALVVFFIDTLVTSLASVEDAGGDVIQPIFGFPGGRRFHFIEPGGGEFAVWAEPEG